MIVLGSDGLPVGRKKSNYTNINGVLHKRCTHCYKPQNKLNTQNKTFCFRFT